MNAIIYGKPRQCGASRFVAHQQQERLWKSMFLDTPYPFEYGPVMTSDGLVTFGVYEKQRHLPVPIKHYQP